MAQRTLSLRAATMRSKRSCPGIGKTPCSIRIEVPRGDVSFRCSGTDVCKTCARRRPRPPAGILPCWIVCWICVLSVPKKGVWNPRPCARGRIVDQEQGSRHLFGRLAITGMCLANGAPTKDLLLPQIKWRQLSGFLFHARTNL